MKKKRGLSARDARAVKSAKTMRPKQINYSDIPELSDRQLSSMRRVGRPTVGDEPEKTYRDSSGCKGSRMAAQDR
jgi:hypothetical protein